MAVVERIGLLAKNLVKLRDNATLLFGDGTLGADSSNYDVQIRWDGTDLDMLPLVDDSVFKIGNGTLSMDVWIYGASSSKYLFWDASASRLYGSGGVYMRYGDSDVLEFGNAADVTLTWDATNLVIAAAADDSLIEVGDAAGTQLSFDMKWYGDASDGFMYWDASADTLLFSGGEILSLQDASFLKFGDSADVTMNWDGTRLVLEPAADDTGFEFGISAGTQKSFDVRFWGNDSASYMMWDASASRLAFLSGGYKELKTWTTGGGAIAVTYGTSGSTGYIPIYTTAA